MLFSAYFRSLSAAKKVALLAVFIALSIVVNCFSIDVSASNKIAFTYVVCFFAGFLLGGVPAFGIALLGDVIGYLVNPVGVYWLFGLTLGVYAFLMGVVMNFKVRAEENKAIPYVRAAVALLLGYLLITVLLNSAVNYWYAMLFLCSALSLSSTKMSKSRTESRSAGLLRRMNSRIAPCSSFSSATNATSRLVAGNSENGT